MHHTQDITLRLIHPAAHVAATGTAKPNARVHARASDNSSESIVAVQSRYVAAQRMHRQKKAESPTCFCAQHNHESLRKDMWDALVDIMLHDEARNALHPGRSTYSMEQLTMYTYNHG
jgi:hypothetical protein